MDKLDIDIVQLKDLKYVPVSGIICLLGTFDGLWYLVSEETPMFCFAAETMDQVVNQGKRAISQYDKMLSDEKRKKELELDNMSIRKMAINLAVTFCQGNHYDTARLIQTSKQIEQYVIGTSK